MEASLGAFNELYSKYKYMETSFERSKNIYKSKVPDIEQTLELIKLMLAKKDEDETMLTNYSLSDTLYSTAEVRIGSTKTYYHFLNSTFFQVDLAAGVVYLWIGAGTMVEYSFEEAIELLESQLVQTHSKIAELVDDLNFLRGNSITVEVNMARLFNHSVKLKKLLETAK